MIEPAGGATECVVLRRHIEDAQVDFTAIQFSELIQTAFELPADQISGPKSLDEPRFDVQARLPTEASNKGENYDDSPTTVELPRVAVHHIHVIRANLIRRYPKWMQSQSTHNKLYKLRYL